jgi:UDP-N-acetylglucosamine 1-carboxyvinyltransferase
MNGARHPSPAGAGNRHALARRSRPGARWRMDKLLITGGNRLDGEVRASGAKNAALPILAATLLAEGEWCSSNVPHLRDITTTMELLGRMGVVLTVDERMHPRRRHPDVDRFEAPYDLVKTMRASILVLGPLLARFGEADVSLPGGCAIGAARSTCTSRACAPWVPTSASRTVTSTPAPSAAGAHYSHGHRHRHRHREPDDGRGAGRRPHVLENAAREPEVVDLANFLNAMGARIRAPAPTPSSSTASSAAPAASYSVLPDRIETGTYLVAAAMTGGRVRVRNRPAPICSTRCWPSCASAAPVAPARTGSRWTCTAAPARGQRPHRAAPGLPDRHAGPVLRAEQHRRRRRHRHRDRLREPLHARLEMQRMGADIQIEGNVAICRGVDRLTAAPVMATDLRASASLVLAGLVADGETLSTASTTSTAATTTSKRSSPPSAA